jgi:hypothetical protein
MLLLGSPNFHYNSKPCVYCFFYNVDFSLIYLKLLSLFIIIIIWFFETGFPLCSPGCPGTHSVDQAGFEIRNLPASASQVLGLKACTTTARLITTVLSTQTRKSFCYQKLHECLYVETDEM